MNFAEAVEDNDTGNLNIWEVNNAKGIEENIENTMGRIFKGDLKDMNTFIQNVKEDADYGLTVQQVSFTNDNKIAVSIRYRSKHKSNHKPPVRLGSAVIREVVEDDCLIRDSDEGIQVSQQVSNYTDTSLDPEFSCNGMKIRGGQIVENFVLDLGTREDLGSRFLLWSRLLYEWINSGKVDCPECNNLYTMGEKILCTCFSENMKNIPVSSMCTNPEEIQDAIITMLEES